MLRRNELEKLSENAIVIQNEILIACSGIFTGQQEENNHIMNSTNCFYISGMTEDCNGGIFRCIWRNRTPEVKDFYPLERNLCLSWGATRETIYASTQHNGIGAVAAYNADQNGKLHLLNKMPANGQSVCFLQISPDGKFLYSANYASGNISEFTIAADGSLAALKQNISHSGKSIHAEQTSPHPHCCTFTPDKKYLCVTDLGTDKIIFYPYDPDEGASPVAAAEYSVTPGSGPRHLFFDPGSGFAYLICELSNVIQRFSYTGGNLNFIDTISTLPTGENNSSASTMKFSGNGRFLFAGNRGSDTIAVFAVNKNSKLTAEKFYPAGGSSPRDFNFLPGTNILAVANEFSGKTVFFTCDDSTGQIFEVCGELPLPRPLFILV